MQEEEINLQFAACTWLGKDGTVCAVMENFGLEHIRKLQPGENVCERSTSFLMVAAAVAVSGTKALPGIAATTSVQQPFEVLRTPQYILPVSQTSVAVLPTAYAGWLQRQMNLAVAKVLALPLLLSYACPPCQHFSRYM